MTWALMGVLAAITALVTAVDHFGGHGRANDLFLTVGIVPAHFRPWSLLTYSFFHESFGHLLVNIFYLWVFGGGVEEAVGRGRYLALYVASGAVGGALQAVVTTVLLPPVVGSIPIVGASAACAGLIGLFAVRYYRTRLSFVGLPFRPHVVVVIILFLGFEISAGVWDLLTRSATAGVASWAHVGGFVFGLACAHAVRLGEAGSRAYLSADAAQAMDRSLPGSAIKRWEILLAREPNNATARAELARAWLLLGDTEQAAGYYLSAIEAHLSRNHRAEAALLYAEMRDKGLRAPAPTTDQLFVLGNALEELEQFALAAETLRAAAARDPHSPAAETALLKVITLYVHRLDRCEEANILLRLFLERYPHSQWRALAEDLRRAANRS
jgi:membrane associated rhomboid family serine protease